MTSTHLRGEYPKRGRSGSTSGTNRNKARQNTAVPELRTPDGTASGTRTGTVAVLHQRRGPAASGSRYGRSALERDLVKLQQWPKRHLTLFHIAANAGALVAGGELDEVSAELVLKSSGRRVGLPEYEVCRTVEAGMRRGSSQPRYAPRHGQMVSSANDARDRAARWWQWVSQQDWSSRRGPTTLKILAGFYTLASGAGKLRLVQSYREIAEAAGVSVGTVSKHEPVWSRYVAVVSKGNRNGVASVERPGEAKTNRSVFQLVASRADSAIEGSDPWKGNRFGNRPEASRTAKAGLFPKTTYENAEIGWFGPDPASDPLANPAADYWWSWSGGWRLLGAIGGDGASLDELCERLGRSRRSVRAGLRQLEADCVVERCGELWRRASNAAPETPVPYGQRRRERHVTEREAFAMWIRAKCAA